MLRLRTAKSAISLYKYCMSYIGRHPVIPELAMRRTSQWHNAGNADSLSRISDGMLPGILRNIVAPPTSIDNS